MLHPRLTINGHAFDSVYQFTYTFPGSNSVEYIYFNRGAGFLKIVQDNPLIRRTLELERWNVSYQ
jgi:hypothetical protein